MDKKQAQLGMNPSTAANRLRMDILFSMAIKLGHKCHRCGDSLNRETFSIEHIEPWLDSERPTEKFFDLENIAFSHLRCNRMDARRPQKKYQNEQERLTARNEKQNLRRKNGSRIYSADERRAKYLRTGS